MNQGSGWGIFVHFISGDMPILYILSDIVYIGTLHPSHAELSKMMLKSGKHVLCEKPMAMNKQEVEEVLTVAKEQKKFFMEVYVYTCSSLRIRFFFA